ncbi:hypothetical protein BFR47_17035 [Oceanisphaera psychrotolerans]|uniref:Cobalamin-independent methionine synthase MetE C-terminal/archaeal domain-containing protein n=1 Tax=Oceanisphaera psychrotolerans TaxID=1414654 RepID=A0A1J4QAR5_9GAMM|nr:hypothetical protein BFR47_17035 [Oceanisphaera psychrotolerans]
MAEKAFRLRVSVVADSTQIYTYMCYSEFNEIIEPIARLDADMITIEPSRSDMELLDVLRDFAYPNEIGPGVYEVHSHAGTAPGRCRSQGIKELF